MEQDAVTASGQEDEKEKEEEEENSTRVVELALQIEVGVAVAAVVRGVVGTSAAPRRGSKPLRLWSPARLPR